MSTLPETSWYPWQFARRYDDLIPPHAGRRRSRYQGDQPLTQVRHGADDFGYFSERDQAKLLRINKRF